MPETSGVMGYEVYRDFGIAGSKSDKKQISVGPIFNMGVQSPNGPGHKLDLDQELTRQAMSQLSSRLPAWVCFAPTRHLKET